MDPAALSELLGAMPQQDVGPLVEFKAGKCTVNGTVVTADPRRGTVKVVKDVDGTHFQWLLRPSGTMDLDIKVLPGEAKWEKIPECKDGRVYLLRLSRNRKYLFWMQEPAADKDEQLAKDVNKHLNTPVDDWMGQLAMGGLGRGGVPGTRSDMHAMDEDAMDIGGAGGLLGMGFPPQGPTGSSAPAGTGSGASGSASSAAARPSAGTGAAPAGAAGAASLLQYAQQLEAQRELASQSLTYVLDADRVMAALDEQSIQQLLPMLPESQRTREHLHETLRSPQFKQTISRVSHVLNGPQFASIMTSLGLPLNDAVGIGVRTFLQVVQKQADKEKDKQGGDKSKEQGKP